MKQRSFDARGLDVEAFAAASGELAGHWPAAELARLLELQAPPLDMACGDVDWQVRGERRALAGGEAEIWLSLAAQAPVWLVCQRCLQPLRLPLSVATRLRFVRGESQAEALDAQIEDDVLALSRSLDLQELVEDELMLALPLVPRHGVCPEPIVVVGEAPLGVGAERANPFASLQALKSGRAKPD